MAEEVTYLPMYDPPGTTRMEIIRAKLAGREDVLDEMLENKAKIEKLNHMVRDPKCDWDEVQNILDGLCMSFEDIQHFLDLDPCD